MDTTEFIHNVSAHTLEDMTPYQEQYVAWSEDGKRVLAHARRISELYSELDRLDITHYVVDFIPDPDVSFLAGGIL